MCLLFDVFCAMFCSFPPVPSPSLLVGHSNFTRSLTNFPVFPETSWTPGSCCMPEARMEAACGDHFSLRMSNRLQNLQDPHFAFPKTSNFQSVNILPVVLWESRIWMQMVSTRPFQLGGSARCFIDLSLVPLFQK